MTNVERGSIAFNSSQHGISVDFEQQNKVLLLFVHVQARGQSPKTNVLSKQNTNRFTNRPLTAFHNKELEEAL